MDWDKLRIFHLVAKAGSFTRGGESLGLSQSAVSRQISALEESLGVTLFHRHARGLMLTEQGEMLNKTAQDIFGRLAMAEGRLADARNVPEGPLRITAASFLGSTWLAPMLGEFRKKHPGVELTLLLDDRIFDLGMREADAAIRLYEPEQHDLIYTKLATIGFQICGSKSYFKSHPKPEKAKDLRDHTLLGYPDNTLAPFSDPNWIFRAAGIDTLSSKNLLLMNSLYAINNAVAAGAGIAALPDYLVAHNKDLEVVLPSVKRRGVDMFFVYPEERRDSARIALFRDFLLDHIKGARI